MPPFVVTWRVAIRENGLSATERAVAWAMSTRMDADGQCYPSLSTIATDAGLGRSTAARAVASLVRRGYLQKRGRSQYGTTKYQATIPANDDIRF